MLDAVRHILDARSLSAPDGRPLYAYKASDAEFKRLEGEVRDDVREHRYLRRTATAAFCLYGAEHFSRGDGSDWWAWDSLRTALSLEHLSDQDLRDATACGLKFWERRVLSGGRGREYLATLVCEGGLPLALLRTEGGSLRRYFRDLLEQHETYPHLDPAPMAVDLSRVLPVRMQNVVVHELAVALVRHVAALRGTGATNGESVGWPAPLRLDSESARQLVDGLRAAPRPSHREGRGIRATTTLVCGPELVVRRELTLPRHVSPEWLRRVLGVEKDLPPRLYISVGTSDGARQTIGVATLQGEEYLVRPTGGRAVVSPAVVTDELRCILSFGGKDVGAFVPVGGEALCEAPWTFDDVAGEAPLRATGTWSSRDPSLLVAVSGDGTYSVDGEVEQVGAIVGLGRTVVRVHAPLRWIDDWDDVRITPNSVDAEDGTFELNGRRVTSVVREADAWLGRPRLVKVDGQGVRHLVPDDSIVWRQLRGNWTSDLSRAMGVGELGVRIGEILFRARVRILPADFSLSLRCGGRDRGGLAVRGSTIDRVGVEPAVGQRVDVRRVTGGFDVDLAVDDRRVIPATLVITVRTSGEEVVLTVPFPIETLALVGRGGRVLDNGEALSLDGLAHVRAVAISPGRSAWAVDLHHHDHTVPIACLVNEGSGVAELPLEPLRPLVAAALAANPSLDYAVKVSLVNEGVGAHPPVSCTVRRYDAILEPRFFKGAHCVELERASAERLGDAVVASLHAEAIPLLHPDTTPTHLPCLARGRWGTGGLSPGPWLVLLYQNDYLRGRPLRITVPAQDGNVPGARTEEPGDRIAAAMHVPQPTERRHALRVAVAALGTDTTTPGWKTVRAQMATLGRFPASTFDVVRSVTEEPRVAVLSLLDAGANAPSLWRALEELPFLWATVSLADWTSGVRAWLETLRTRLPLGFPLTELAREAAPWMFSQGTLAPFLCVVHDALYLLLRDIPAPSERSVYDRRDARVRQTSTAFVEHLRSELLLRHADAGGRATVFWPTASPFSEVDVGPELASVRHALRGPQAFQDTVLRAPALLAERVAGRALDCDVLTLRQVREFDPEWFDDAFAISLAVLLGSRYETKGSPFHE